jgi:hypothetical protein
MRAAINFDTLEYMAELKRSGMKHEEAEAITKATAKAFIQMMELTDLSTKKDLLDMKMQLQAFIVRAVTSCIVILGGIQTVLHFF